MLCISFPLPSSISVKPPEVSASVTERSGSPTEAIAQSGVAGKHVRKAEEVALQNESSTSAHDSAEDHTARKRQRVGGPEKDIGS